MKPEDGYIIDEAKMFEEMSKSMDDVVFLKVDVDDCEDVAAEYKVYQEERREREFSSF